MAQRGFLKQQWTRGAVDGKGAGMAAHPGLQGLTPGISIRTDSYDVSALQLSLERIKAQVYTRKKPTQEFLPFVDLDTSGGAGLAATGFREGDARAKWKKMGPKSSDFETADVKDRKHTFPVISYFSGWDIWWDEIQTAARAAEAGQPYDLSPRLAMACMVSYDELLEDHCLFGDIEYDVYGYLNHPDIKRTTLTSTALDSGAVQLTPSSSDTAMYATLIALWKDVFNQSTGIEKPNVLMVPGALYREAASTYVSGRDQTVLQRFQATTGMQLVPIERFATVTEDKLRSGGSSAVTTSVALAARFDAATSEKRVPLPFYQMDAHTDNAGFRTVTPCVTQIGGLHVYYPLAYKVYEGIWSAS